MYDNWPLVLDWCDSLMFLEAFLDDSNSHKGAQVVVFGGAVAPKSSWNSIIPQWKAVLKKFNVEYFHASELNNLKGDLYGGWDEEKRYQFLRKLTNVLKSEKRRLNIFYIGVRKSLYDEIMPEFPTVKLSIIQLSCEWSMIACFIPFVRNKHIKRVALTIDRGSRIWSQTMTHLNKLTKIPRFCDETKVGPIVTEDKKKVIPLQVADLVAYEFYKDIVPDRINGRKIPRLTWYELRTNHPARGGILKVAGMREYLEETRKRYFSK